MGHIYRDAVTGRIVSAEYAAEHPETTERETVDTAAPASDEGDAE